jgi:CrcB protein
VTALDPAQLVGLGGAVGAVLRYATGRALAGREFPVATLTVNAVGTFVLGLATFGGVGGEVLLAIGTGACGSFTTFSSVSFETVRLWEAAERLPAAVNAVANLVAAGLALGLAWWLVGSL